MKTKRLSAILMVLTALLLLPGCSTFRKLFDEAPEKTAARKERAKERREAELRGEEPESRFPDPVGDLFELKRTPPPSKVGASYDSLTPEERKLVQSMVSYEKRSQSDADAIRERQRRNRKAQETWVFGGNPFE